MNSSLQLCCKVVAVVVLKVVLVQVHAVLVMVTNCGDCNGKSLFVASFKRGTPCITKQICRGRARCTRADYSYISR
jgi:hypothetical protein